MTRRSRVSLRLPQSVKARVDEVAAADGISTNAWLIRAVMDALATPAGRPSGPGPHAPDAERAGSSVRTVRSARTACSAPTVPSGRSARSARSRARVPASGPADRAGYQGWVR